MYGLVFAKFGTQRRRYLCASQAMSTRYTNAVVNKTFEPPHTFKNDDGSEGIAVPPHVRRLQSRYPPVFQPI